MVKKVKAQVDEEGRLILPPELISRYGLNPGTQVLIDERTNDLRLLKPVTHLEKVYIEPTNCCNLNCRTCIRNVWDESLGQMSRETFSRIMEGLKTIYPPPIIFFGGFGEPLSHPDIIDMVCQAKSLGTSVEMITNATLLSKDLSEQLIEAGLDRLWVSLDGASPANYEDLRLGAALPEVLANIDGFNKIRWATHFPYMYFDYHMKPQLGMVFVAMKRNIADLPFVLDLAKKLGATRFLITNLLPHTTEMSKEILYSQALTDPIYSSLLFHLDLPKINLDKITRKLLYTVMRSGYRVKFSGSTLGEGNDVCPFVETGATAINWEGNLSPCLPLLHSHMSYLYDRERFSRRYIIGNVVPRNLRDLWNEPEYMSFRDRIQKFDFSPCTWCSGCELSEKNEEDCFGSPFPTCGGCLWAQGVIQCP